MNRRDNVREFKRLDGAITTNEREVEVWRWRQAELAAEAVDSGMTQKEYATAVGKSQSHISTLTRMWAQYQRTDTRPTFSTAYETLHGGGDQIVTQSEGRRRRAERQVPTRHEDRVEMAETLLADPDVAKEAVASVLAEPSKSQRVVERAVKQKASEQRRRSVEAARERAEAEALPLPAYFVEMIAKVQEWALGMAGLYELLDELPEGHGRELVTQAIDVLGEEVDRWRAKLHERPTFVVIEGRRTA